MRFEDSAKLLLAISFTSTAAYADLSTGLIGGVASGTDKYSAFVSSDGTLAPIAGVSLGGQINSVSLNKFGDGLIGGQDNNTGGYAAFVSSGGALDVLNLSLPMGNISGTSINNSGNGIVGGNDSSGNIYAAFISKDGTINPLTGTPSGFILSTALNDDGIALIGGEGTSFPYAAYVTPGGMVNQIDTSPLAGGHLLVAINSQGNGIIGGISTVGAYAALVKPDGSLPTPLTFSAGPGSGITSVAINNSGSVLIGGYDASSNIYAGYYTAAGVVTPLFGSPNSGQISSVAINSSGAGLIGGILNSNFYAAFVQPDGSLNVLLPGSVNGGISTVAINDAGVGLIGGQFGSGDTYAALVAPNGTLTVLEMTGLTNIASVALRNTSLNTVLNATTPQSVGPYFSGFYTQLAASAALESRFVAQNRIWMEERASQTDIAQREIACNDDFFLARNSNITLRNKTHAVQEKRPNSLWIAPFGNYVNLKAQGSIPSYTNEIGGFLLGYDRYDCNYIIGTSAGYAFNYIGYSEGIGHSKLQEEMVSLYGAYYFEHFWFDMALWGGLYQLSNVRHTLSTITSKSSTHGWILSPHVEMASPWAIGNTERYFIEPFFMLDWVNDWRDRYTESGSSGFNLDMGNLYGSLLQSEVGLRFYERFEYKWGDFCLEEKLSYINQAPFNLNTANTSFVGAASTFSTAVGSTQVENLCSTQLIGSFIPRNRAYPFGGFAVQVTANKDYQSYFASLFTGIDF